MRTTKNSECTSCGRAGQPKPYAMVGAGKVASAIWKVGDDRSGWEYRFSLFRLSPSGRVEQRFRPNDLISILKTSRVLAATLADDGCLGEELRDELIRLADELSNVLAAKR